jgi:hypothetical protein
MGGSVVSHDKAAQSLSINPIFKKGGLCFFYNFYATKSTVFKKLHKNLKNSSQPPALPLITR